MLDNSICSYFKRKKIELRVSSSKLCIRWKQYTEMVNAMNGPSKLPDHCSSGFLFSFGNDLQLEGFKWEFWIGIFNFKTFSEMLSRHQRFYWFLLGFICATFISYGTRSLVLDENCQHATMAFFVVLDLFIRGHRIRRWF